MDDNHLVRNDRGVQSRQRFQWHTRRCVNSLNQSPSVVLYMCYRYMKKKEYVRKKENEKKKAEGKKQPKIGNPKKEMQTWTGLLHCVAVVVA